MILLVWAPLEDWEAMGSSLDSTEKALQVVSSHLLDKVAWTSAGAVSWIFLTTLRVNMDGALRDAVLVHDVQGCLEELEQCTLALEQEPRGPEEPSISDDEAVSDGDDEHETKDNDDEHCETAGPHLAARPAVQQKLKHEQPVAQGDIFNGPQCD